MFDADSTQWSNDLEGMNVWVAGSGQIGTAVLRRLKTFDVNLYYTDRHRLPGSDQYSRKGNPPVLQCLKKKRQKKKLPVTELVPVTQHSHSFPFAFSKASLPSEIEKYTRPAAPIASAYANAVSS